LIPAAPPATAEPDPDPWASSESDIPTGDVPDAASQLIIPPARSTGDNGLAGRLGEGGEGPTTSPSGSIDEDSGRAPDSATAEADADPLGVFFADVPVAGIRPNPRQPRSDFDDDALEELAQSITLVGVLQPVVVRQTASGWYELVMGERRWRAARRAGLEAIPAVVRSTPDADLLRNALLENLHRADLNALEEAAAYQQLLDDFGATHEELAARVGRSRPHISNTLRLLRLSPQVQRKVAAGILSAGHARALVSVTDPERQDRLATQAVAQGLSVRALEELVGDAAAGASRTPRPRKGSARRSPELDELAGTLSERFETRCRVEQGSRSGKITIEFADAPDLQRIVGLLQGAPAS
jgi:ParB family chromosome partitioning protein